MNTMIVSNLDIHRAFGHEAEQKIRKHKMNTMIVSNLGIRRAFGREAEQKIRKHYENNGVPIGLLIPACSIDRDGDRRVETMALHETLDKLEWPNWANLMEVQVGLDKYTPILKLGDNYPDEHDEFDESMDAVVSACDTVALRIDRWRQEARVTRWGGFYPWHHRQLEMHGGLDHWDEVAERMAPMWRRNGSICVQAYADTPDAGGITDAMSLLAHQADWCNGLLPGVPVTIDIWHRAKGKLMVAPNFAIYCERIRDACGSFGVTPAIGWWSVDNTPIMSEKPAEPAEELVAVHGELLDVFFDVFGKNG